MRTEVQTQLAKLLSKEDIQVIHGEYRTAFFDVERRILGLPNWKDLGKDVYDLLVGHEVGHALFTPAEGWHDSDKEIPGVPRSFINVVEDIRIERKVQEAYPGLIASFRRGYSVLDKEDFFGTADRDIQEYKLIDRINLKSKLGNLVDVEFSETETPVFNRAMAVDTWEDVLNSAREIYEFMKEEQEQEEPQGLAEALVDDNGDDLDVSNEGMCSDNTMDGNSDGEGRGQDSKQSEAPSEDNVPSAGDQQSSSSEADSDGQDAGDDQGGRESAASSDELQGENDASDSAEGPRELTSETDDAFRHAEENELVEQRTDSDPLLVQPPTKQELLDMVVPYSEVTKDRAVWRDMFYNSEYCKHDERIDRKVKEFYNDNKRVINLMVKEFEMRKAAYQYSRSKTSKTGALNMGKLHEYKYNDDIFLSVRQLADAKSHGLVMFMDRSGSMGTVMGDVVRQTVLLAEFCRRVNIPFDVYGFTTGDHDRHGSQRNHTVSLAGRRIVHLLSSSFKRPVFTQAVRELFEYASSIYQPANIDGFGATPLIETIMAAHHIVAQFKGKHKIEKPVALFLTDGEATKVQLGYDNTYSDKMVRRFARGFEFSFMGKKFGGRTVDVVSALTNNLRKSTGAQTVVVHLTYNNSDARRWIWLRTDFESTEKLFAKFRKNKYQLHTTDIGGFDHAFIMNVKGDRLKAKDDDFVVADDMSTRKLKTAFRDYNRSKRENRSLMTAFAAAIA